MLQFSLAYYSTLLFTLSALASVNGIYTDETMNHLSLFYKLNSDSINKHDSSVHFPCLIGHCMLPIIKCYLNSACRKATDCISKCSNDDTTCTNVCFFKYSNALFESLIQCTLNNGCGSGPKLSNSFCPMNIKSDIKWSNSRLLDSGNDKTGTMYVIRGIDKVFDCLPCQKMVFHANDDSGALTPDLKTEWTTAVENKFTRQVNYTLHQMNEEIPFQVKNSYRLFGMQIEEHYYMLDYTEDNDFIFYYYCGYGFTGEYQGAEVYARNKDAILTNELRERFNNAIVNAGLQDRLPMFKDVTDGSDGYCLPSVTDCPNF